MKEGKPTITCVSHQSFWSLSTFSDLGNDSIHSKEKKRKKKIEFKTHTLPCL